MSSYHPEPPDFESISLIVSFLDTSSWYFIGKITKWRIFWTYYYLVSSLADETQLFHLLFMLNGIFYE